MGNGLFTSEGAFWLRQRRIAQGAFQKAHLPIFGDHVLACVADAMPDWERKARANEPVPLRETLTELILRATLRMLFGVDAQNEMPVLVKALHGVHSDIKFGRLFLPVKLPAWVPTPSRRRFSQSMATVDEFIYRIIHERQAAADPGTDLVGLLVRAQDPETGERMNDRQLHDEVATMIHAGHDTVTDATLWTLVLLARHPEMQARVRDEVERTTGGAGRAPRRCRPWISWARVPRSAAPLSLGLGLCPERASGGHLRLVHDPEGRSRDHLALRDAPIAALLGPARGVRSRSLPARRLGVAAQVRAFPFGSGPRMCIGANMALLEAPLIVASVLQRFDISLPPDVNLATSPASACGRRPRSGCDCGRGDSFRRSIPIVRLSGCQMFGTVSPRVETCNGQTIRRPAGMIQLTGVSKSFDGRREVTALAGIDLRIERGEMVSIIGPSGSGKSTLLNLMGALDTADAGRSGDRGAGASTLDDHARTLVRRDKIGFIFQFFNLLPSLTALENVALPLHLRRWPRAKTQERARELLALVGLEKRVDHLPDELSAANASASRLRALSIYPPILLGDEPTGNLDTRTGAEILALIRICTRGSAPPSSS